MDENEILLEAIQSICDRRAQALVLKEDFFFLFERNSTDLILLISDMERKLDDLYSRLKT